MDLLIAAIHSLLSSNSLEIDRIVTFTALRCMKGVFVLTLN